jgi:hypothetical protein
VAILNNNKIRWIVKTIQAIAKRKKMHDEYKQPDGYMKAYRKNNFIRIEIKVGGYKKDDRPRKNMARRT